MNKTPDELWDEARVQLAQLKVPAWCTIEYGFTASKPQKPCVRLSRTFEGEKYEASLCLPWGSSLLYAAQNIIDTSTDEAIQARRLREAK